MSENSIIDHAQKVQAMKLFINHVGIDEAAHFIVNLQSAVENLTSNNQSFVRAFADIYMDKSRNRLAEIMAGQQENKSNE